MIRSFKDDATFELFTKRRSKRWASIRDVALRKLDQIEAAYQLSDLASPPGNRLEPLKGTRAGQHSIRINDQYRVCFVWKDDGVLDVQVTDYHDQKKGKKHAPRKTR